MSSERLVLHKVYCDLNTFQIERTKFVKSNTTWRRLIRMMKIVSYYVMYYIVVCIILVWSLNLLLTSTIDEYYSEIMKIYIDSQLGFSKPNIFVWRAFSLTNRCSWSDFSEHSKLVIDVNSTTPDPGDLILDSCSVFIVLF